MTQQLFYFEAEHINRSKGIALVRKLEDEGVEVEAAAMDPTFADVFHMIVTTTQDGAKKIRESVWIVNHGTSCFMTVTDKTELDW